MENIEEKKSQDENSNVLIHQDKVVNPEEEIAEQDSSTPDEELQEIINTKTSYVDNILLDINKVSNTAFNPEKNPILYRDKTADPIRIAMERRGSKKEINTLVALNFDFDKMEEKGLKIKGTEKLNQFDRIVLDAINTLYIEGKNEYITTAMIFHVLTGDPDKRISPKYAREINNSITKLLFTHIVIKADEESIMYPELRDFEYHDTIVPGKMVKAKLNGTEVACIQIRDKLPLYLYASKKNQISVVDIGLLKIHLVKETPEQMTLLFYLLRRIVAFKSISNRIRYDTLYHDFGYDNASPKKKFDFRKNVKAILDAWKGSAFGDIKLIDYTEEKKGLIPYEIIIEFEVVREIKKELQD